jgi:predicted transposase YdaD
MIPSLFPEPRALREAREEARAEVRREVALNFLRKDLPIAEIAEGTGLTIEQIQQLQAQLPQE